MAAGGAGDAQAVERDLVLDRADVGEAVAAQALGVLGLAQQRHVATQQAAGGVVEVVLVQVGDQHGVEPGHQRLRRLRELDEGVGAGVGRVRDRGSRAGGIELRVDEQPHPRRADREGRVADQREMHDLHGISTGFAQRSHVAVAHSAA